MSHLRSALAGAGGQIQSQDVLVTTTGGVSAGYALRLEMLRVDASRFKAGIEAGERALRAGDYAISAHESRDALSLWRGQPLYEVAERSFALAEVRRLEDMFRRGMIVRVAADVAAKEHRSVISDLEHMVTQWPDVMDLRVLLTIALYRSSHHAEAARACHRAIQIAQDFGLSQRRLNALLHDVLTETLPRAGLPHTSWES
jgi:DNA-binding SARP family transcriptional activator